ncbi:MAG: hypothetical protein ACI9VS_000240 [Candidatus Binatia bacterium]|jgi:hypothetical protein
MLIKKKPTVLAALGLAGAALAIACATPKANAAPTPLPVQPSCTVDSAEFASWFQRGRVTKDGIVTAADSLQSFDTLCDFYAWSWRMFLWQTSENSGGYVFNTAPFFDLNDKNELVSNSSGYSGRKFVRGGKLEDMSRTGQAGLISGVLMTQGASVNADGSLVYYAIHVNDVMAYMASGVNNGGLTGVTQFPTTVAQRDAIIDYAQTAYGVHLTDPNALALELKSSWVKLNSSMDASQFITIKADIPSYTQSSDQRWTWNGTSLDKGVTLACVGYHLVGSAAGHPEMIWATFEHYQNAPDANFYYRDKSGNTQMKKNWNSNGTPVDKNWLFMDGVSREQANNQMHMELKGNDILATPGKTISPSNTMRTHPWGGAPDQTAAGNNTAIISINQNISSMLASGDVRKNYFLVGATWTKNGVPNIGFQIPDVAGSITLANASMETYFQYKNCFDCHHATQGQPMTQLTGLSHIFGIIQPLAK